MKTTPEHDQKIARLTLASVWPHYVTKIEKKGRTSTELYQVVEWLTGFTPKQVDEWLTVKITLETFFQKATLHPNATLITGVICGYRIEEIETPLTYLDKLVDELAKGRKMDKILR